MSTTAATATTMIMIIPSVRSVPSTYYFHCCVLDLCWISLAGANIPSKKVVFVCRNSMFFQFQFNLININWMITDTLWSVCLVAEWIYTFVLKMFHMTYSNLGVLGRRKKNKIDLIVQLHALAICFVLVQFQNEKSNKSVHIAKKKHHTQTQ